jgi:hypothetical protein
MWSDDESEEGVGGEGGSERIVMDERHEMR